MATFNRSRPAWRITSSAILLIGLLLAALGLSFVPPPITQSLRAAWREALLPRKKHSSATSNLAARSMEKTPDLPAPRPRRIPTKNRRANRPTRPPANCNCELARSLALAPGQFTTADERRTPSLLIPQLIPARVLGQQAQAFLLTHDLLDVGRSQGALPNSLVIDEVPQLLDQGRDASVKPGRLVLAGSRVWGKVAEVGPHTCTVRRITDAGYRDLVQLATPAKAASTFPLAACWSAPANGYARSNWSKPPNPSPPAI